MQLLFCVLIKLFLLPIDGFAGKILLLSVGLVGHFHLEDLLSPEFT